MCIYNRMMEICGKRGEFLHIQIHMHVHRERCRGEGVEWANMY